MIYAKVEGQGKPFVVVHGFLGMSDNWKTFASAVAPLGYQMHLLDMRNHGRSFHSDEFSYEIMAEDIREYCEANSLENIVLLGHSMGGKVSMYLSCKYPYLVDKLIVVDIAPKYYAPHHQNIMAALNAVQFSEGVTRSEIQEIISSYIENQGEVQFLMKNVHRVTPTLLGYRFNLKVFNENEQAIGNALPENFHFNKPTIFIKGSLSNYIMQNDEILIKKHFSNVFVYEIEGSGHWIHADKPQELFNIVQSFLDK